MPCMPTANRACVHHDEHVLQPTVLLAHQKAGRASVVAELQYGRRARLDAELVFNRRRSAHRCARQGVPSSFAHELRNHEQRYVLHTLRCVRRSGQHKVHDVLGHIVVAPSNEYLGPEHLVAAVALPLRTRTDEGKVEPACGSVRFIVPDHTPSMSFGR